MKKIILILFLPFLALFAQDKKALFSDADFLLSELRKYNADVFSPENFAQGMKYYKLAEKQFDEGENKEKVFATLQNAESFFYKALERSKINSDLFAYTYKLKLKAEKEAGNSKPAKSFLEAGEKAFAEGIALSEKEKDLSEIKEKIKEANGHFQTALIVAKKENVFTPVVKMREAARKSRADLYSPQNFKKGEKRFNDAIDFASRANGEDFIKSILSAERFYKEAYSNAILFSSNNPELQTAIKYAEKSGAPDYAKKTWNAAVEKLTLAAEQFENKKFEDSQKNVLLATKLFWDAEEEAIYNKYIGNLKARLDSLKEFNDNEFTQTSVRKTELLLKKADKLFTENRYDKKIATYSAKAEKELERLEKLTEIYRTKNEAFIDSLILNDIYPFAEKSSEEKNEKNTIAVQTENFATIKPQKKIVAQEKNAERKKKEPTINKSAEKKKTPQKKVAKAETPLEKTIAYCEKVFSPDEAVIVETGKNYFRIRLTGLKLKAYQKQLTAQQKNLLMKLRNVIFYTRKVKNAVVEVYSDSMGGDELNKRLSQSRADIVKSTLVRYGVPAKMIRAEGIGNKNPIASNDTFEGRNKNRRIEVLLYF